MGGKSNKRKHKYKRHDKNRRGQQNVFWSRQPRSCSSPEAFVNVGKRRVFAKFLKSRSVTIPDVQQAKFFVEGMETYSSKAELLAVLQDTRENGAKRIRDVLSFINSLDDVKTLLIPVLGHVMNEETSRPVYVPLRDTVLFWIFMVPRLMSLLVTQEVIQHLDQASCVTFCAFLSAISKSFLEPRQSEVVRSLAKALRTRGDVDEAKVLCNFLLVDETEKNQKRAGREYYAAETKPKDIALWVNDTDPPGGRNDNDHLNFRDIQLLPTVEELSSSIRPYLPLASGQNKFIEDPVASLLDRNFRILREDAVASMKENLTKPRAKVWSNARIVGLEVDYRRSSGEISFWVRVDSRKDEKMDWGRSKALMHNSVVALCRDRKPTRLGIISIREDNPKVTKWLNDPLGPTIGVTFDSSGDFDISLSEMIKNRSIEERLYNLNNWNDVSQMSKSQREHFNDHLRTLKSEMISYDLVEVSTSFFAYRPVLETLQAIEKLPFADELVGTHISIPSRPEYLPDMVSLPESFGELKCDLKDWNYEEVKNKTSLDKSQSEGLRHSLTSRVVLIQGPPGTGKTFMGSLDARVIRENTDESILCVCYTNHALDQFLEQMLDAGETRIVRIGGRSTSNRLSGYQLKELSQVRSNDQSSFQWRIDQVRAQLRELEDHITYTLKNTNAFAWKEPFGGVCSFLKNDKPEIYSFLSLPEKGRIRDCDPAGYPVLDDYLWNCWLNGEKFPHWIARCLAGGYTSPSSNAFWDLPFDKRLNMLFEWQQEVMQPAISQINEMAKRFVALKEQQRTLHHGRDLEILSKARIIGATTSGAAAHHSILSSKAAGVVIVEEAGEVLEAHVLTALSSATKHLILIGDHKQLPPKVENYGLTKTSGRGYNLDCSLFERLVLSGLTSVTLETQHRMRPAISALIREQTYPSLQDHVSVQKYPDVKGVSENVVFINHAYPELDNDDGRTTKSNLLEAEISVELVRFFLWQGYSTENIVILTPYLGQLHTIIDQMRSKLKDVTALLSDQDFTALLSDRDDIEDLNIVNSDQAKAGLALPHYGNEKKRQVRCSSIDNFQGEEADIVVISLVRSNRLGKIGFLKEKQRVNVLLSRARYGMYLVGNRETFQSAMTRDENIWKHIIQKLDSDGRVLNGLPTICQLHPDDKPMQLCSPGDFQTYRPNGGCQRRCTFRLFCGHVCPLRCHPTDRGHQRGHTACAAPCMRIPEECKKNHPCPKLCKEKCGPCTASVGPVTLACGHIRERVRCHEVCTDAALARMSDLCKTIVNHTFAECGHEAETFCSNARHAKPHCPAKCGKATECGHKCARNCADCARGGEGHSCYKKCLRLLYCGHQCNSNCHGSNPCGPCKQKCTMQCMHSRCNRDCHTPCSSCVEPCHWYCSHQGNCSLVCGAPCSRLPCNQRCERSLSCGHRCPSLCGELCPDRKFCRECGVEANLVQMVDMINLSIYRDHKIDGDPIIFLGCGHFFATSTLDGCLGICDVYEMNESRTMFTGLKQLGGINASEKPKQCPTCRAPIYLTFRYGRILRLVELRSLERKHMASTNETLKNLAIEFDEKGATKNRVEVIKRLEVRIKRSPMNIVFEACKGALEVERIPPPAAQLIQCLELKAKAMDFVASKCLDKGMAEESTAAYQDAIKVADESASKYSGAKLRLGLAKLMVKHCNDIDTVRDDVIPLVDWVLELSEDFSDLVEKAKEIKEEVSKSNIERIRAIMAAVPDQGGYSYGGSASSHWYACPNGHPYFIANCGGAVVESRCAECRLPIGGREHQLTEGNTSISGAFLEALQDSP